MIVVDEQLQDYGLCALIARWYPGRVVAITQLRPQTLIFDDAIPTLLRRWSAPTFVTINVHDFWGHLAPDPHFGVVCVDVPHVKANEVSRLIRRAFALDPLQTRRQRLGKIVRVRREQVEFYTVESNLVQTIAW